MERKIYLTSKGCRIYLDKTNLFPESTIKNYSIVTKVFHIQHSEIKMKHFLYCS